MNKVIIFDYYQQPIPPNDVPVIRDSQMFHPPKDRVKITFSYIKIIINDNYDIIY